jgi:hypothetical protein
LNKAALPQRERGNVLKFKLLVMMFSIFLDGGLPMNQQEFVGAGVSIILPTEPGFTEALKKLQLDDKPGMEIARPGSVILNNHSQHSIVSFGLRWKIKDSTGFVWTRDLMHMEPRALLDGGRGRAEHVSIRANTSCLITVEGMIANPEALRNFRSSFLEPGFTVVSVQLDSAIFDDGEIVGPDQIGMVPVVMATINARQDLMEEISGRVDQGESLHKILAALNSAHKRVPQTHAPLDPEATYAVLRQQYLDELTTTEQNFGEEVAMRSLKRDKYDTRPDLHRRSESQN